MNWPNMDGWAPETLGALIGATAAGLIAIALNRAEATRQRRAEVRTAARNAFSEISVALAALPDAIVQGVQQEEAAHFELVKRGIAWTAHIEQEDRQVEKDVQRVLTDILAIAYRLATGPVTNANRVDLAMEFRAPGSKSRELMDGFLEHGKTWHVASKKKDRESAAAWFRAHAS
jgi:hypothetical protein